MTNLIKPLFCAGAMLMGLPSLASAASITPDTFSSTIDVGETVTVEKTVTLDPEGPAVSKVDVFFLADNTGSMAYDISTIQSFAGELLDDISGDDPRFTGIDAGFGVGRYVVDPSEFGATPDSAYTLLQPINTSTDLAQDGINEWASDPSNLDDPEGNFFALHQVATEGGPTDGVGSTDSGDGTGQVTGWRDGAGKVIVWLGDAPSHQTTVDLDEAIAALTDENVTVAALNTEGSGFGIDEAFDDQDFADFRNQASTIIEETGGTLTNNLDSADPEATLASILDSLGAATSTIDLELVARGDVSGLDINFTCTSDEGCTDVDPGESRSFEMSIKGLTPGTYDFDTIATGVAGAVETDSITVVPEPSSVLGTLAFGAFGAGLMLKRRHRKKVVG